MDFYWLMVPVLVWTISGGSWAQNWGENTYNSNNDRNNGFNVDRERDRGNNRGDNGNDRCGNNRDCRNDQNRGTGWNQGSDRGNGNDQNRGTSWNQGSDRGNGNDQNRGTGWNQGSERGNGNDQNRGTGWNQGSDRGNGNDQNRGTGWNQGSDRGNGNDQNRGTGWNQGSDRGNGNDQNRGNDRERDRNQGNDRGNNRDKGDRDQGYDQDRGDHRDQDRKPGRLSDNVSFPGLNKKDVKEQLVRAYWPWIDEKFPLPVQSPVAISTKNAKKENLPAFIFEHYWENKKELVTLKNDGKTVQTTIASNVDKEDRPLVKGGPLKDEYLFEQMHMHWGKTDSDGSEHTLNGKSFSTEMHIVHYKAEYGSMEEAQRHYDGIAVVAFFGIAKGNDNKDLAGFIDDLERVRKCNSSITIPVKRTFECVKAVASARLPSNRYFTYPGSLTTPPYSESVIWIVFPDPFEISSEQLNEFRQLKSCDNKALIRKNDRELQPFNNRPVIYAF